MRLPGTCSRYSKNAIPQLSSAATYQGRSARFFRWAYQAKVMKMLEAPSSSVADSSGFTVPPSARDRERTQGGARAGEVAVHDAVPAARARAGDVVGPVVDEHRGGGCEREAPLGLGVDAGVRLHAARQVG